MGMVFTTYVGPYIEVEYKTTSLDGPAELTCVKLDCGHIPENRNFNYCGRCGNELYKKVRTYKSEDTNIVHDVLLDNDECFFVLRDNLLGVNGSFDGRRLFFDRYDEELHCEELKDSTLELNNFKKAFKSEIEEVSKVVDKLEIKWGIVTFLL